MKQFVTNHRLMSRKEFDNTWNKCLKASSDKATFKKEHPSKLERLWTSEERKLLMQDFDNTKVLEQTVEICMSSEGKGVCFFCSKKGLKVFSKTSDSIPCRRG